MTVDLIAHLFYCFLVVDLLSCLDGPHKGEQFFYIIPRLNIDQVDSGPSGAVGGKLMLCQKGLKILGQVRACSKEL